jgi:hypothetical protein
MIVNHTHRFLMVHVPKTAGTSIKKHLSSFTQYRDLEIIGNSQTRQISEYYGSRFGLRKHSSAQKILSVIGADDFNSFFRFAFVRNPLSRCYSTFRFLKFNWRDWSGSEIMETFSSFEDFVMSEFFQSPGPDRIFQPQVEWVCDKNLMPLVDFVGRTEHIDRDFLEICKTVGLPSIGTEIATANVSKPTARGLAEVYANNIVVSRVIRRYLVDFEAFGYKKVLF